VFHVKVFPQARYCDKYSSYRRRENQTIPHSTTPAYVLHTCGGNIHIEQIGSILHRLRMRAYH